MPRPFHDIIVSDSVGILANRKLKHSTIADSFAAGSAVARRIIDKIPSLHPRFHNHVAAAARWALVKPGWATLRRYGSAMPALAVIAAGYQPILANAQCMFSTEKASFDMRVLQSSLMVAALTCNQRDEYNVFMVHHQRDATTAYDGIAAHFTRLYGSAGETQRDAYISELANVHALESAKYGPGYCNQVKPIVLEALALRDTDDISRFVAERRLTSPYAMEICETALDTVPSTPERLVPVVSKPARAQPRAMRPDPLQASAK